MADAKKKTQKSPSTKAAMAKIKARVAATPKAPKTGALSVTFPNSHMKAPLNAHQSARLANIRAQARAFFGQ